jgi:hypothetical protein
MLKRNFSRRLRLAPAGPSATWCLLSFLAVAGGTLCGCAASTSATSAAPSAIDDDAGVSRPIVTRLSAATQPAGAIAPAGLAAGLTFQGWTSLSGGLVTDPSIVNVGIAHYNAVATGPDGNVYSNWYDGTKWGGWTNLGNAGSAIAIAPASIVEPGVQGARDIAVFAIDSAGSLLQKIGVASTNLLAAPTWGSTWQAINPPGTHTLATKNGPPTVVLSQPNSQVNVFATLEDSSVGVASGFLGFMNWTLLEGAVIAQPGAVSWGPDRLDVFAVGPNDHLYHRYSGDNGQTWYPAGGSWEYLAGTMATTPQVASWGPGRLDVFGGYGNALEHLAYTGAGWGTCSAPPCWETLPGIVWADGVHGSATPTPITLGAGDMNVFVQGGDHSLEDLRMTAQATATTPSQWQASEVASCFRTGGKPAVVSPDGTNLTLAMTGFDPSGDTAVWSTSSGPFGGGTGSPPACGVCGVAGSPCCDTGSCNGSGAVCNAALMCECPGDAVPGPGGLCGNNRVEIWSGTVGSVGQVVTNTNIPTAGTYAYSLAQGDLPGAIGLNQRVEFAAGAYPRNQTLIAYSSDYTGAEGFPCLSTDYVALSGGAGNLSFVATNVNLQKIVRYVDGTCRIRVPYTSLFQSAEATTVSQIQQPLLGIQSLDYYEIAQPQFGGRGSNMSSGFLFFGKFDTSVAGVDSGSLILNPGYGVGTSADGLLASSVLGWSITTSGVFKGNEPKIEAAIDAEPAGIEKVVTASLTQPFSTLLNSVDPTGEVASLVTTSCTQSTPSAPSTECYGQIQPLLLFAGAANPPTKTSTLASAAANALTAENFTCDPTGGAGSPLECNFHPIIQAVNVLPTTIELVMSPSPTTSTGDTLTAFYEALPASATTTTFSLGGMNETISLDCSDLIPGVTVGSISTIFQGDAALALKDSGSISGQSCAPIMTSK